MDFKGGTQELRDTLHCLLIPLLSDLLQESCDIKAIDMTSYLRRHSGVRVRVLSLVSAHLGLNLKGMGDLGMMTRITWTSVPLFINGFLIPTTM